MPARKNPKTAFGLELLQFCARNGITYIIPRVTHSGGKNMKYYNIDENIACTDHGMTHKGGCNA